MEMSPEVPSNSWLSAVYDISIENKGSLKHKCCLTRRFGA
jgi:hypothetical protein